MMKKRGAFILEFIFPIVNLLLVFISIIAPLFYDIYEKNVQSRSLEASLVKLSYLKNADFPQKIPVEVYSNRKAIDNLVFIKVRFINHGNTIKKSDIIEPVKLRLENVLEILDAKVVESDPNDICCTAKVMNHDVILSRVLLNPNDSFTIELYCSINSVSNNYIKGIEGRIVDLHKIRFDPTFPSSADREELSFQTFKLFIVFMTYIIVWRIMDRCKYRHKNLIGALMWFGFFVVISKTLYHFIVVFNH